MSCPLGNVPLGFGDEIKSVSARLRPAVLFRFYREILRHPNWQIAYSLLRLF